MVKEYRFQDLVTAGRQDDVKEIVKGVLHKDGLENPSIKEVLLVIFFEEGDSWGRNLGHLFEYKFSLEVLALVVSLVC